MLKERHAVLDLSSSEDIVFIIDGSESASPYRERIFNFLTVLFRKIPLYKVSLYFLSNSKNHNIKDFSLMGGIWQKECEKRGSFITPIFASMVQKKGKIMVIGSGEIYDLADWQDTPFWNSLLLINLGDAPMAGNLNIEEIKPSDPTEILTRIHNPVEKVEIIGNGFMPYFWDNSEYSLILDEKGATLVASEIKGLSEGFSVSFTCFSEEELFAKIKRQDGGIEEFQIQLHPICSKEIFEPPWQILSEEEGKIFNNAIKGIPFICPICKNEHPPSTLICDDGMSILGRPVYQSFMEKRGIFLLKEKEEKVYFCHHPAEVIRIDKDRVAILEGLGLVIYQNRRNRWLKEGPLRPYFPIKSKNHYIVVII